MRNIDNGYQKTNQLFPKNNYRKKNMQFKLTPIKQLKQKFQIGLPQNTSSKNTITYTPQKLSSAITAKLKSTSQNSIKFHASVVSPKSPNKKQKYKIQNIKSQRNIQSLDIINQRKISNLLNFKKQKSHSMHSVSAPHQNLLPYNHHFTQAHPNSKHILRMTKIRQMFNYLSGAKRKSSKIVQNSANLTVLSRKLTLLKQQKISRSVPKTQPSYQNLLKDYQAKISSRTYKKTSSKQLNIKPVQIIAVRIQNMLMNPFKTQIQYLNKKKQITPKSESFRQSLEGWRNNEKQHDFQTFIYNLQEKQSEQKQKHEEKTQKIQKNRSLNNLSFSHKQPTTKNEYESFITRTNTRNYN